MECSMWMEAVGLDGIPVEALKAGDKAVVDIKKTTTSRMWLIIAYAPTLYQLLDTKTIPVTLP